MVKKQDENCFKFIAENHCGIIQTIDLMHNFLKMELNCTETGPLGRLWLNDAYPFHNTPILYSITSLISCFNQVSIVCNQRINFIMNLFQDQIKKVKDAGWWNELFEHPPSKKISKRTRRTRYRRRRRRF